MVQQQSFLEDFFYEMSLINHFATLLHTAQCILFDACHASVWA